MKVLLLQKLLPQIERLDPININIDFPVGSESIYINIEYHTDNSSTDILKLRISNHRHPSTFNGLDIYSGDMVAQLKRKVDQILWPGQ